MSTDAREPDPGQAPTPSRGPSCAVAFAFLFFLWLAVEMLAITTLGTSGSGVFKQNPPARTPEPTAK